MQVTDPTSRRNSAVILLGHGTEENAGSAEAVRIQAALLRRGGLFGSVHEAFWKQSPHVEEVLSTVQAAQVFIVPLFMAEGYFAARVIPEKLGFVQRPGSPLAWPLVQARADRIWLYCAPVGTHPKLSEVAVTRAETVLRQYPFPRLPRPDEISLFLAGHGTERDPRSRESVEALSARIRALRRFAMVGSVFLEESPRIPDCYQLAQTRRLVIVPAFISDGLHTLEDIPVLLGESPRTVRERLASGLFPWRNPTERQGHLVWYTQALGSEPALQEVILERIREAAEALEDILPKSGLKEPGIAPAQ